MPYMSLCNVCIVIFDPELWLTLIKILATFIDDLIVILLFVVIFQDNVLYSGGGDNHVYAWDLESGTCTVSCM